MSHLARCCALHLQWVSCETTCLGDCLTLPQPPLPSSPKEGGRLICWQCWLLPLPCLPYHTCHTCLPPCLPHLPSSSACLPAFACLTFFLLHSPLHLPSPPLSLLTCTPLLFLSLFIYIPPLCTHLPFSSLYVCPFYSFVYALSIYMLSFYALGLELEDGMGWRWDGLWRRGEALWETDFFKTKHAVPGRLQKPCLAKNVSG